MVGRRGLRMTSVFLSYDRDDSDKARLIASALEKAGHTVWWDLHVRSGAQYSKAIEKALKAANAVVVLWSRDSVESAWVRDEAAAGRDRGRLLPVSLDGTEPPLGFRQFQTLDLSAWKGRGTPRQLRSLLSDVADMGSHREDQPPEKVAKPVVTTTGRARLLLPLIALVAAVAIGAFWLIRSREHGPPTVAVMAADSSAASKALARNVLFRLGSLDGDTATNIRLLDEQHTSGADLRVSVNAAESSDRVRANIALVSPSQKSVLWSQEFQQPAGRRAELEEAMAFAAGRVLGCAIEEASGTSGRLSAELRRLYLTACSSVSEAGWDTRLVIPQFRRITEAAPKFRPAWAQLLSAEKESVSFLELSQQDTRPTKAALTQDIAAARKIDPNMAEATLAEIELDPERPVGRSIALVDKAKTQEPNNPTVLMTRSAELQRVGRMRDAVDDATQAAKLDPLSASTRANLISVLLYAGEADRAREELAKAKQLFPNAPTISEAEYSLELRLGDVQKAIRQQGGISPAAKIYVKARLEPTRGNIATFLALLQRQEPGSGQLVFGAQGLGEINRVDDFYALIGSKGFPSKASYVLFRPWMASVRSDPRFMRLSDGLGLVDYWKKSGNWPDFCLEPGLKYDCKTEAAKLK